MRRREFFLSSLATSLAAVKAQSPTLKLGYDTYSLRAWRMKALEHLDFAGKHGCTAIQLSSLDDFESLEPAHLAKVKARAAELNIVIDAGTGCICPTSKAYSARNGDPVQGLTKAIRRLGLSAPADPEDRDAPEAGVDGIVFINELGKAYDQNGYKQIASKSNFLYIIIPRYF